MRRPLSRCVDALERHTYSALFIVFAMTVLLAYPARYMNPTEVASTSPDTQLFTAAKLMKERMSGPVHVLSFVIEDPGGDVWRPKSMRAFEEITKNLRESDLAPKLWSYDSSLYRQSFLGVLSPSDLVLQAVRAATSRTAQTDPAEATSLAHLSDEALAGFSRQVAKRINESTSQLLIPSGQSVLRDGVWRSPAIVVNILTDQQKVGGGGGLKLNRADPPEERFGREVLKLLRAHSGHLKVYGVALDANLSTAEQGRSSGVYVAVALFVILLFLAVGLKSYWVVTLVGLGLATLMIWLKGANNLMGLKSDPILSLIVPIAMVSFGVDAGVHSICRYREERAEGAGPIHGLRLAFLGTLGALTLAAFTDLSAFLVNVLSPLESVRQFGLASAMALSGAFILLGVVCPLLLSRVERIGCQAPKSAIGRVGAWLGILISVAAATVVVMCLVFVDFDMGLGLYLAYVVLGVLVPLWITRWRAVDSAEHDGDSQGGRTPYTPAWLSGLYEAIVDLVYRRPTQIVLICAVLWAAAVPVAMDIRVEFDIRHLLHPGSELVQGLDVVDKHLAGRGGEPSAIYIEGPLAEPRALDALGSAAAAIRAIDDAALAKLSTGETRLDGGLIDLWKYEGLVRSSDAPKTPLTRPTLDRWLKEGVRAPAPGGTAVRWAPDEVETMLWIRPPGQRTTGPLWLSTRFEVQLAQTQSSVGIRAAEDLLAPIMTDLRQALTQLDPAVKVTLTGGAVSRQAELDAVGDSMLLSLPIALALCLLIVSVSLRSIYKALACVLTLGFVVTLLFASMRLLDYGLNFMSATLGALAIGIGIDYATHVIVRIDEERENDQTISAQTLSRALGGTGHALFIAAGSSVLGFCVLGLAPMPLFAAYGRFTAVMIALSLLSSLVVLPALLRWSDGPPSSE